MEMENARRMSKAEAEKIASEINGKVVKLVVDGKGIKYGVKYGYEKYIR